jgi:hypothetical protein
MTHKKEISSYEVLGVLSGRPEASPVACKSFMEANDNTFSDQKLEFFDFFTLHRDQGIHHTARIPVPIPDSVYMYPQRCLPTVRVSYFTSFHSKSCY